MRAFSTDLKTGTGGEVTYLGWLLSLTPVTLSAVYLNTTGEDYTYSANVYLGNPGFVMGSARFTDGSDPASLDVEIPVSDDGPVTPDNVTAGMYQGAAVVLRIVDYVNADVSPPIGFKWVVGATRITDDGMAVFELRADTRINRELILKTFQPACPYNLGDARCGKDLTSFTDTVEVDSITSLYEFTVTGSARADGFFDNGAIRFTNGGNASRAYTVRKWTLSTRKVLLWEPLKVALVVGDDATIHAGCDKTTGAAGCTKFSNIARYGGFANLPNSDTKFTDERPSGGAALPVVTPSGGGSTYPGYIPAGGGGGWFHW
jgi:uncharacterized phage protein (TIGR02218 family)